MRKQDAIPMLKELIGKGYVITVTQRVFGKTTTITKENLQDGVEILKSHNDIEWYKNDHNFLCCDKPNQEL